MGPEVQRMLEDLQMVDKTRAHAKYLSGGMKRKLRYTCTYLRTCICVFLVLCYDFD